MCVCVCGGGGVSRIIPNCSDVKSKRGRGAVTVLALRLSPCSMIVYVQAHITHLEEQVSLLIEKLEQQRDTAEVGSEAARTKIPVLSTTCVYLQHPFMDCTCVFSVRAAG